MMHAYRSPQDGFTTLYLASERGQTSVVQLLVMEGADVHICNEVCIYDEECMCISNGGHVTFNVKNAIDIPPLAW